jgi:hypothetical protein
MIVNAVWIAVGPATSHVDVRLADATTGAVLATARLELSGRPSPLLLARGVVAATTRALASIERLPAWTDPMRPSGGSTLASGISSESVAEFLRGLAAEERWAWEEARRAYQAAADQDAFYEAEAALARTARLRLGGTLGEN